MTTINNAALEQYKLRNRRAIISVSSGGIKR